MPLIRKDASTPVATPDNPAAQLRAESREARWSAARALAGMAGSETVLGEALARETDPRVREAIFTSLARQQTAQAVEVVLPYVRSQDAAIRTAALDALSAMPGAVEAFIPALLGDADSDVRLLTCDVVRRLPGSAAARALCALLENESQPNVCAAAIEALSEVGDTAALPALARCRARFADEPFLLFAIQAAVSRIGGDGRTDGPQAS